MAGYCLTGQSPQRAVVLMEEEEAIPPFLLYAFMACAEVTLPFIFRVKHVTYLRLGASAVVVFCQLFVS
jgi:hypothetical protein